MERFRPSSILRKVLAPIVAVSALAGCDTSCPSAIEEQTREAISDARLSEVCADDFEKARKEAPLVDPIVGDCEAAETIRQLATAVHCNCLDGSTTDISRDLYRQANFMCPPPRFSGNQE